MTRAEAIEKAEEYKRGKDSNGIVELLMPFWREKKTIDVACLLAYAYRRMRDYTNCHKICDEADVAINSPSRIKTQRKWCYLFEEILDEQDLEVADKKATSFLATLSPSGNDFAIVKFMCQVMAEKYEERNLHRAIFWLEIIESRKLDNKVRYVSSDAEGATYREEQRRFRSEKFLYYSKLASLIIDCNDFDSVIGRFLKYYTPVAQHNIISILRERYQGDKSRLGSFSKLLMLIKEESFFIHHAVSKSPGGLVVTDIASYAYCPVSFAINKTVVKQDCSLDYDEEALFSRKFIVDYYEKCQRDEKDIKKVFGKSLNNSFSFTVLQLETLRYIFTANRHGQNVRTPNQFQSKIFKGSDISGSPDLVLQQDVTFCVEEVFTSTNIISLSNPYENDKIKMAGYIYEFGFDHGYLFYWNTVRSYDYETKKNNSLITGLKIFKIERSQLLYNNYIQYKTEVKNILGYKARPLKPINYNKCMSCSVFESCIHKRGFLKEVKLPYKENYAA